VGSAEGDADAFVAAHPGLHDINAGLMFRGPVPPRKGKAERGNLFGGDIVAIYTVQVWPTNGHHREKRHDINCLLARRTE
jgi:hypothetical protein